MGTPHTVCRTSNSETDLREHLEAIGRDYNSITNKRSYRHYLERRKQYLSSFCGNSMTKDAVIVDLAAGTGNYSGALSNYYRLLNMDLSFNALKASTILNDKILRINANALNIPLKDNTADVIFLIGILHHIPHSLERLFQEILRVIKKDGLVIIDEPNGYNITWFIYMKLSKIDKIGTKLLFAHSLKKIAKRHHFLVEKESFWGFVPPWPDIKITVDIFSKIEYLIESSPLSLLCARYLLLLRK